MASRCKTVDLSAGHTACSCVSTRQYTTAKDVHAKKVYEDANLQNGGGRNQMWSGFLVKAPNVCSFVPSIFAFCLELLLISLNW
jgi:hypothetical protein